ncbi:MAG TPA: Hsp70 family protein [Geodermatophilus sp.]|nr:Hsp70 family protein [Geodermatophilus sp.]
MGYCLGVDLGTTFVAAAVAHDASVEMFALGDRSTVMPAAVYLREDGALVTGDAAARRAVSNPDRVATEIKRRLGDPTPVLLGGTSHAVTDLLGTLLQDVLARVTAEEREGPDVVVLTHPANWGPFRRELFEEVPRFAGLSSALTVTEPEAAAAYYAATRKIAEGDIIAVYDLGGGTFDATVLQRTTDGIEILGAPEGIERLGGTDFDEAVLSYVNHAAGGALSELDLSDPRTVIALARLRQDCVLAKEALSLDTETTIPVFLPTRHLDVRLTRAEFEDMIRAPLESTIGTLSRALRTAGVTPSRLAAVLLVGGSSRIPLVPQMISRELGRPTVVDAHPKHAVALGAAIVAQAHARPGGESAVLSAAPERQSALVGAAAPVTPLATTSAPGSPVEEAEALEPGGSAIASPPAPPVPSSEGGPPAGGPRSAPPSWLHGDPRNDWPPRDGHVPDGWADGDRGTGPEPDVLGDETWRDDGSDEPAPPPGARQRRIGRRPLIIAGAVLLVVLAVVAALVTLRPDGSSDAEADGGPPAGAPAPDPGHDHDTPQPAPDPAPAPETSVPIPSIGTTTIDVGKTPGFVVVNPTNGRQLYIANRTAGVVTVVDTAVDRVTAKIPISDGPPQYLTFSPDGRRLYVSVFDDAATIAAVTVLDTSSNSVLATIPVQTRPFASDVTPDGSRLFVPNHDSGTVSVIDTASNKVTDVTVPAHPHWVEVTPDGSRAYVANHNSNVVTVLDTNTLEIVTQVQVENSPHSVAVHPTRPLVANVNYDSDSVTMIDTNTHQVIARVPVGYHPQDVTWSADGRFAYATAVDGDSVTVINADNFSVTATLPTGDAPTSIAVLPDGSRGYITNLNSGTLTVLDLTA